MFPELVTVDILSVQPQCKICKGVTVWTVLSDRDIKRLRTGGIVSGVAQLDSNGCGAGTLRVELGTASCYLTTAEFELDNSRKAVSARVKSFAI